MSGYVLKSADTPVLRRMSFRNFGLRAEETIAGDLGWMIKDLAKSSQGLRLSSQVTGPDFSEAVIEGGVPGDVYLVTSEVETSAQRHLKQSVILRVGEAAC